MQDHEFKRHLYIGKPTALQCLDDDTYERLDVSKVVIQLIEALEYQVSVVFGLSLGDEFLPALLIRD